MSKLMHAAYWAVIVVLGIMLGVSRNASPSTDTVLTPTPNLDLNRQLLARDNINSEAHSAADLAAVQRQMASLVAENTLLKEQLETAIAQLSEVQYEADAVLAGSRNNSSEPRQPESIADVLARNARNLNLEAIDVTSLGKRLEEEPVDYNWAYEMDMKFRDFLLSSNALSNIQVENINCRTEVCEFEMRMINEGDDFNTMTFHREFSQQDAINLQDYMYLTMHESGSDVVRLILEKRDTSD
ncbi:hypothetical protein [Aliidiomarina celeris]|uniref:hypothetical protein n=1 Tax=Aliidiomarina celeris TaxID=2249428 RepID=UPI000DEA505E|nr:hypothetical protein [Aliidiomarina celeris]